MQTKTIIAIVATVALIAFAVSFGNALGGGSLNLWSPTYTVEADNAGDSPQIIVNGRSNNANVSMSPEVARRERSAWPTWVFLIFATSLTAYAFLKVANGDKNV